MKYLISILLVFLFLTGCSKLPGSVGKTQRQTQTAAADAVKVISLLPSKVAFNSDRDENVEIYTVNVDGSNLTRLTNSPFFDGAPDWSADGKQIAFLTDRDGNAEIYTMDASGNNLTNLTNNPYDDTYPDWSPDMQKIVFESVRDGDLEIYVMNADGSNQTRLTNNPGDDYGARWSPDGSQIAFSSMRDGNLDVYVMKPDGSGQTNITNHLANDCNPSWSGDGNKLSFDTDRDGNYEIYSMNSDGSNPIRLTYSAGNFGYSDWAPDGQRIIFSVDNGGDWDIFVMDSNGGNIATFLTGQTSDFDPRWSPGVTTLAGAQAVTVIPPAFPTSMPEPTLVITTPTVGNFASLIEATGWIEINFSGSVTLGQETPTSLDQLVIFHGLNTVGTGFGCQGCYALEPSLDIELNVPNEDINGSDIIFRTGEEYQYLIKGYLTSKTVEDFWAGSLPVFEVSYLERLK